MGHLFSSSDLEPKTKAKGQDIFSDHRKLLRQVFPSKFCPDRYNVFLNNDIELAQVTLDQDYEKDQKKFSCEEVTSNVSPKGRYKAKRLYKLFLPETLNLQK